MSWPILNRTMKAMMIKYEQENVYLGIKVDEDYHDKDEEKDAKIKADVERDMMMKFMTMMKGMNVYVMVRTRSSTTLKWPFSPLCKRENNPFPPLSASK